MLHFIHLSYFARLLSQSCKVLGHVTVPRKRRHARWEMPRERASKRPQPTTNLKQKELALQNSCLLTFSVSSWQARTSTWTSKRFAPPCSTLELSSLSSPCPPLPQHRTLDPSFPKEYRSRSALLCHYHPQSSRRWSFHCRFQTEWNWRRRKKKNTLSSIRSLRGRRSSL